MKYEIYEYDRSKIYLPSERPYQKDAWHFDEAGENGVDSK